MFAKKPPPEPIPPSLPPILYLGGPMDLPKFVPQIAPPPPADADVPPEPLERISRMAPSDHIAHAVIAQALREGASGVTLTPSETVNAVQYRIDGEWRDTMNVPIHLSPGLVSAFKTLAGLPTWEHRMVLQGLIPVHCTLGAFDVQIEIVPTRQGEKITMQIEQVPG